MQYRFRRLAGALVLAAAGATACGGSNAATTAGNDAPAAQLVPVKGSDLNQVELRADSVKRLGVTTAPVQASTHGLTVPFGALLYDNMGVTWVYTVTGDRTYERSKVDVATITGDTVVLRAGPPAGTQVVTVGGTELFGVELGVGLGE